MKYNTDVLVIGSGIAGLNFVLQIKKIHPNCKVTVITKGKESESNTELAQGGIAIVHHKTDSIKKHIEDTIKAGDGLCNENVVSFVVNQGPIVLKELEEFGVVFDKNKQHELDLGMEGGHSKNRIVHVKDTTGKEIEKALLTQVKKLKNVTLLKHHFVLDLLKNKSNFCCEGAIILNEKEQTLASFYSQVTFIATGGAGQIYKNTTNPKITTGDGIAMCSRIGVKLNDLEFIQFHPTTLYQKNENPVFLISEAVRGIGAKLLNHKNERFMSKYDDRLELASRDIVSRAIHDELEMENKEFVQLKCDHLIEDEFKNHFKQIYEKCNSLNINPSIDPIPVCPAQHYFGGGIVTDINGQTTLNSLFAAGECASTGLHGANRLASNSLLEAFVFSKQSAISASKHITKTVYYLPQWINYKSPPQSLIEKAIELKNKIQQIMWDNVGIKRSNNSLSTAKIELMKIQNEVKVINQNDFIDQTLLELKNIIEISLLVVEHSQKRRTNKGGFYNINLK